jgi:RNA polymerase sigma-70 factor (ECF subfamily)
LHVMEQLTPPERGVFVLREAFEFKFGEIAEILDVTEQSARQLYHRAQQRIADDDTKRFDADPKEHAR